MQSAAFPFQMTVCGLQELEDRPDGHVSHVLSILDPAYPLPPALASLGERERLELRFHDVIDSLPERDEPQPHHIEEILRFGRAIFDSPEECGHLLVHCHLGVSRSTAAMTLILALGQPELSAPDVLSQLLAIRAIAWPNLRMLSLGEDQLGRRGEFTSAEAEVYSRQLKRKPELKEFLIRDGRARELELALGEPLAPAR
jgi:predicted protein tyrosine phosphatase